MENVSERALMKHLQKEQERERRRIRDRQRRQSMSAEERERHLARRRRNYQLRRQRAENARLELQLNQQATAALAASSGGGEYIGRVVEHQQQHQMLLPVPEASNSAQFNGLDSNGIVVDPEHDSFKAAYANPVALEVAAHDLAKLPKQPRIKHIKQLARSLARSHHENDTNRIAVDLLIKANPTLSCLVQQKGLRFTRLKRLARSLHCDAEKKAVDQLQDKAVEHNQPEVPQPHNIRQEQD
ncbi:unnamed protein product [Linum trigynum]|uniref:Uncharacterized protein n=1 Tax=Linum trigynum TaxID=586398 RepID=A0AAV2C7G4_9ROSI